MAGNGNNKDSMDELNKIIDRYTEGNYLIGKTAKEEMAKDILALFNVVGRSEQLCPSCGSSNTETIVCGDIGCNDCGNMWA